MKSLFLTISSQHHTCYIFGKMSVGQVQSGFLHVGRPFLANLRSTKSAFDTVVQYNLYRTTCTRSKWNRVTSHIFVRFRRMADCQIKLIETQVRNQRIQKMFKPRERTESELFRELSLKFLALSWAEIWSVWCEKSMFLPFSGKSTKYPDFPH